MKFRSTLILLVLAVVGVVAVVIVEGLGDGRRAHAGAALAPLLEPGRLPVDAVSRIMLDRGEGAMIFDAGPEGWTQTAPIVHPMDAFSMRQLPAVANAIGVVDVIEPGSLGGARDRAALGLDPPRTRLRFAWTGGELGLVLGRRGIGGMAYAEIEGDDRIYVVTQELHERASEMDVREWRERGIFRSVGVDSDRIMIESGPSVIELVREQKQWRMQRPVRGRVNAAALDALLQALGHARVAAFVLDLPDDRGQFGLDQPVGSVTVETARLRDRGGTVERETEIQRLSVGARIGVGTQDRFAVVDGRDTVVRVSEPVLRALFLPAGQIVALTGSGVVPADVKTVRIEGTGGAVGLTRKLDTWIAPDAGDRRVDAALVTQLLDLLTQVPATEVTLGEYPRNQQVALITMFGYDGRPLDTVRIAREPASGEAAGRWIFENGDNVLRYHPAGTALRLTPAEYGL